MVLPQYVLQNLSSLFVSSDKHQRTDSGLAIDHKPLVTQDDWVVHP